MKKNFRQLQCAMILIMCIFQVKTLYSQTLMVDHFDNMSTIESEKFPGYVFTQEGYDIYYKNARVKLSRVTICPRNGNKALRIAYQLPPEYSWGNWLTIRHQLKAPMDLTMYQGLELKLKVERPSPDIILRITLSDLVNNNIKRDELWWFDFASNLLGERTKKWIRIRIPFSNAKLSYGEGARHNDSELNLKKIFAYEINFVSSSKEKVEGAILLDSLRAYKK
ncbi:MAG: carbohydrate binding domain-containing protein [Candidatus Aminicenantes bacterium]